MTDTIQRWFVPPQQLFGWGSVRATGKQVAQLGGSHALVVTDEGVREAGVLEPIVDSFADAEIDHTIFDETVPDPTGAVVDAAVDRFEAVDADVIVAVGGGSSIDTAKAAAAMTTNDGEIFDYVGLGKVEHETPPMVICPTTSGTGSEVTHWSVVRAEDRDVKLSIGDRNLMADVSIVDPALTESVPASVTAATGMDALTHAIEAFCSIHGQSQTDALALDSIEKIGRSLPRAVGRRGTDREALTAMAKASTQAGMAFNGGGLGAVHALSHQVGATFHVPHGLANAIILPYVMEYNLPQVPEELVEIAAALGEPVDGSQPPRREGYRAVRAVRDLNEDIGIPASLEAVDVERSAIDDLARRATNDGSLFGNPRTTEVDDLEAILERAFEGILAADSNGV